MKARRLMPAGGCEFIDLTTMFEIAVDRCEAIRVGEPPNPIAVQHVDPTSLNSESVPMQHRVDRSVARRRSLATIALAASGGLGAAAIVNVFRARAAEAANPPTGKFVEVSGVRVH